MPAHVSKRWRSIAAGLQRNLARAIAAIFGVIATRLLEPATMQGFPAAAAAVAAVFFIVSAIRATIATQSPAALLPLVTFLADTGVTLVDRWRRGENLAVAHKEHYYQRLTVQTGRHSAAAWTWTALAISYSAVALLHILRDASAWWCVIPAMLTSCCSYRSIGGSA